VAEKRTERSTAAKILHTADEYRRRKNETGSVDLDFPKSHSALALSLNHRLYDDFEFGCND